MGFLVKRRIAFNRYPPFFFFLLVMFRYLQRCSVMRRDVKRCSAITLSCLGMCEFVPSFILALGNFSGHIYRYIGIMERFCPKPMPYLPATSFCFWFCQHRGRGAIPQFLLHIPVSPQAGN